MLRGAAFKRLNDLKNDGIFGKEVTIHRTLFNDCKGPKFEELLAVFSTAVLLELVKRNQNDRSITRKLLLESRFNAESSNTVALAYRASFSRQLYERETLGRRWQKFGQSLDSKVHELDQRALVIEETVSSIPTRRVPKRTLDRLRRHLAENWKGDPQWIDIVLRSDKHIPQRTLLERHFSEIWAHASSDALYAVRPDKNESLLQSLQQRVNEQRARIDRWRLIRDDLVSQSRVMTPDRSYKLSENVPPNKFPSTDVESIPMLRGGRRRSNSQPPVEVDHLPATTVRHKPGHLRSQSELDNSPLRVRRYEDNSSQRLANTSARLTKPFQRSELSQIEDDNNSPSVSYKDSNFQGLRPSRPSASPRILTIPQSGNGLSSGDYFRERATSVDLATDIVSSVLNAQPSPTKPLATLAERTRMSIANSRPWNLEQPIQTPDHGYIESKLPPETSLLGYLESTPQTPLPLNNLAERTRQSMSTTAFSTKVTENRQTSRARPSGVNSVSHFATPAKRIPEAEQLNTPVFDEADLEADYETIFKSRPRVALSPTLTPIVENRASVGTFLEMDNEASYEDDFS